MNKLKYLNYIHKNISSFENKVIVVTGANSGIGFCVATYLSYLGAKVIMACRNVDKAKAAINEIKKYVPSAQLDFIKYDQADFKSINDFAKQLKIKYLNVDGFIFNAGIFKPNNNHKTIDGYPKTIGTNYVGAFVLLSLLEKYFMSNKTKLVFVGSIANSKVKESEVNNIIYSDTRGLFKQYSSSKFMIMSTAYAVSCHTKLDINIFHPGVCSTNIVQGYKHWFSNLAKVVLKIFTHSPWKASLGILKLLSIDNNEECLFCGPRGLFHIDGYPKVYQLPNKNRCYSEILFQQYKNGFKGEYKC